MDTIDLGQESDGERELKPVFIGDVSVVTKGVYLLHNLQFEKKKTNYTLEEILSSMVHR